jgi:feruloyl-CoA synthase
MSVKETVAAGEDTGLRAVKFWDPEIVTERRRDGSVLVFQTAPLGPYPDNITDRLVHWASEAPDRRYLAERGPDGEWRTLTYAETLDLVRRLGQALVDMGLTVERPLAILSGNDIEHALLGLAAMHVGIPYAAVSSAYSLVSSDFAKLREVMATLTPGALFVDDGEKYQAAIRAVAPEDAVVIVARNPVPGRDCRLFAAIAATEATDAVERAHEAAGPDTIAKFLFTSGSTGSPKAVINTQRMLCSNQVMVRDCFAFMQDEPPVVLDWAPWNHTAGGNKVFAMVLYNGGTFYIDDGRPTPQLIGRTARNIRDVEPTWYFNVPKGFEELVPLMEADDELAGAFFRRLRMVMYAGAGLAQHTWDALVRLAVATTGGRVLLTTGFGSTETAPFALMCTTEQRIAGNIGVPSPGLVLKLVPTDGKLEAHIKGPSITPGYWRDPELTARAFDAEGFYNFGDAFRFADPDDASKGFYFDGRTAENFKLDTGTWVAVGALRARFIDHFGTLVRDVVIAGVNRPFIGALVFPDPAVLKSLAPDLPAGASTADLAADARVRAAFRDRLESFAAASTGSSTLVRRLVILEEPASLDRGEATDKGSINQRAVLRHREDLVEELYVDGSPRVISL